MWHVRTMTPIRLAGILLLVAACESERSAGTAPSAQARATKQDCAKVLKAFEAHGQRLAALGRSVDLLSSADAYATYAEALDAITVDDGDLKRMLDEHRTHVKRAADGGRRAADPKQKTQGTSEFMVEAARAGESKKKIDALCAVR